MNYESTTEYIRRGVGLKFSKRSYWIELPFLLIFLFISAMSARLTDGAVRFWFCASSAVSIIHIICTVIFVRKKSPLKNKLIVGFTLNGFLTCFLASLFTSLYLDFNMPSDDLDLFYMFLVLIPLFLVVYYSSRLNRPTPMFSKKQPIKTVSLFSNKGYIAFGKLIIGIVIVYFGHFIAEKVIEYIFVYGLLAAVYLCSIGLLDLHRYYCYTKLEKQGLVTEDILRPTE